MGIFDISSTEFVPTVERELTVEEQLCQLREENQNLTEAVMELAAMIGGESND